MSNSLRDQLKGLGFKEPPTPAPKPAHAPRPVHAPHAAAGKPGAGSGARPGNKPAAGGRKSDPRAAQPRTREDIDLAKAYAIRAQKEKDERIEAERLKQEEARLRREAKAKLEAFLKDKALNAADAEHVRHFEYGG